MALPLLILGGIAVAGFSAFAGSQIDDAIENPNNMPQNANANVPSYTTIAYYVAIGLGVYWLANKSGALRALK